MTTIAATLRRRLAESGRWMGREDLARGLVCSEARMEEELADLVVAGSVLFNERGREYRLAGGPLARRAMQRLLASPGQPGVTRVLLGSCSAKDQRVTVGLAVRRAVPGQDDELVMCELQAEHHGGDPDKAQALATAFSRLAVVLEQPA